MNAKNKQLNVLVLGGNGFIGRQIVMYLGTQANVVIGTRKVMADARYKTVKLQHLTDAEDWIDLLQDVDVVVNSVGILRERPKETYQAVHTDAVSALAMACQQLSIRLIHISAIGLSRQAKSGFIRSKYEGEQAILNSGANAIIVRPSLLDGEGGYGAKWFRRVASWPIQFVMTSKGLVAPLQVTDLSEAVAKLVLMPQMNIPKIIELGSVVSYSIPEYLQLLRRQQMRKEAIQISVPKWIVRLASHVFDVLHWTPLSFGHFELMQGYNVPANNMLPALLARQPSALGEQRRTKCETVVCIAKS